MIYAFGDSFTAGLGVDRKWEESQLGGHSNWNTMTQDEKEKQRAIVEKFRNENSYAGVFSRKLGIEYRNFALSGCSNEFILNSIIENDIIFNQGDIVLIGFTSSLRNTISYFPNKLFDKEFKLAPNLNVLKDLSSIDISEKINKNYTGDFLNFFQNYSNFYLTEMYDEKYYEIVNYNIIVLLQKYLEYKKINYIMFDAFDTMVYQNHKHINKKYYWNLGKKTIYSYITSFNDEGLLETEGYNPYNQAPRHPSTEGHKLFAEELYKFYKKVYNG